MDVELSWAPTHPPVLPRGRQTRPGALRIWFEHDLFDQLLLIRHPWAGGHALIGAYLSPARLQNQARYSRQHEARGASYAAGFPTSSQAGASTVSARGSFNGHSSVRWLGPEIRRVLRLI